MGFGETAGTELLAQDTIWGVEVLQLDTTCAPLLAAVVVRAVAGWLLVLPWSVELDACGGGMRENKQASTHTQNKTSTGIKTNKQTTRRVLEVKACDTQGFA